jgi:hypothetical protein
MNGEQLSIEVYTKLVELDYARKVNEFTESGNTYFESLSQDVKNAIRSFPVLLVDHRNDLMDVDNLDGKQQFFIFKNDLGYFLIDTQGYTYPRYITELHQFEIEEFEIEDEDDSIERMEGLIRIADGQIFDSVVKSLVWELKEQNFDKEDIKVLLQSKLLKAIDKVV